LITLGIYRWVWLFYIEDRLQVNGRKLGIKVHPGPGTVLGLWTFGKFILIGPFLADVFIIHNMNKLARAYNASISKRTKELNKKNQQAAGNEAAGRKAVNGGKPGGAVKPGAVVRPATAQTATAAAQTAAAQSAASVAGATRPVGTGQQGSRVTRPAGAAQPSSGATRPAGTIQSTSRVTRPTGTSTSSQDVRKPANHSQPVAGTNHTTKVVAEKQKTVNRQTVTPSSTVTLDVEKNRPRADEATLTVDMGVSNMPMGKK
jgi:hypothetical protein